MNPITNNIISPLIPNNLVANILQFISTTTRSLPDLMEAGLLQENWAWVDQRLSQLFYNYALTPDNVSDFQQAFGSEEKEEQDSELLARKHARVSGNILGKRKRSEGMINHVDPENVYFIPISNNRYDAAIFADE